MTMSHGHNHLPFNFGGQGLGPKQPGMSYSPPQQQYHAQQGYAAYPPPAQYPASALKSRDNDGDRKLPAKRRSTNAAQSRARKIMDQALEKRQEAIETFEGTEKLLKELQEGEQQVKHGLEQAEQVAQQTAQDLLEELLEDDSPWNEMYKLLVQYYNEHKTLKMPWNKKEKDPLITKLTLWLLQQRKDYRREPSDPERLEPYKILALEKLNIAWDVNETHWAQRFEELKKWKEEHGHCRVPPIASGKRKRKQKKKNAQATDNDEEEEDEEEKESGEPIKYHSLGVWVKRQRQQYRCFKAGDKKGAKEMSEERIRLLESIGFEWRLWKEGESPDKWMERYNSLKAYYEEHGHTRVHWQENEELSDWAKLNRDRFIKYESRGGDPNVLSEERYNLLKEINIAMNSRDAMFEERLREFKEFREKYGHGNVPQRYPANLKLGQWVARSRTDWKRMKTGTKTPMTDEKAEILLENGFEFELSDERREETKLTPSTWDDYYVELVDYARDKTPKKKKDGAGAVERKRRKKSISNPPKRLPHLVQWVAEQRLQYSLLKWGKESTLTEEQVGKLSSVGFDWHFDASDVPSLGWDATFGNLLSHKLKNGTFDVSGASDELQLWVKEQREQHAKFVKGVPSLLCREQVMKLDNVSFPWGDPSAAGEVDGGKKTVKSWEEMFANLLSYRIKLGSFEIPSHEKDLLKWMASQRSLKDCYKDGFMGHRAGVEYKLEKLADIGFPWEGERDPVFEPTAKRRKRLPTVEEMAAAQGLRSIPASTTTGGPTFPPGFAQATQGQIAPGMFCGTPPSVAASLLSRTLLQQAWTQNLAQQTGQPSLQFLMPAMAGPACKAAPSNVATSQAASTEQSKKATAEDTAAAAAFIVAQTKTKAGKAGTNQAASSAQLKEPAGSAAQARDKAGGSGHEGSKNVEKSKETESGPDAS